MKKLLILLSVAITILSCDKIGEGERSSIVENINVVRPVLLEDFTGQNCINCPKAAKLAEEMREVFKNQLIVVSIHAGPFSTAKFRTEAGTAYQEEFYSGSTNSYPAGMIDRKGFNSSSPTVSTNISNWKTYIFERTQDKEIPLLDLSLACQYNAENNTIQVSSSIQGISDLPSIKLQLWLTESHIIAPQKSETETIRDYEHNHVLRDAINGIWGEDITLDSGLFREYTSPEYSLEGKEWVHSNLAIVGFIYNAATMEVLHVAEIPMIND